MTTLPARTYVVFQQSARYCVLEIASQPASQPAELIRKENPPNKLYDMKKMKTRWERDRERERT